GLRVENVHGVPLEGGTRRGAPASGRNGIPLEEGSQLWRGVVSHHGSQMLTFEAPDDRALGLAQSDPIFRQRLEDGLQVERRAADDLEQLAGRRLLLERRP